MYDIIDNHKKLILNTTCSIIKKQLHILIVQSTFKLAKYSSYCKKFRKKSKTVKIMNHIGIYVL